MKAKSPFFARIQVDIFAVDFAKVVTGVAKLRHGVTKQTRPADAPIAKPKRKPD